MSDRNRPGGTRAAAEQPAAPSPSNATERLVITYDTALATYDLGDDHPLRAERYTLTMLLLTTLGWLDDPSIVTEVPRPATLSELLLVHSYPYIQAVEQAQAIARGKRPYVDLGVFGLGTSDDPLFPDIHDAAALYTGATIQAMAALLDDRATHAYSPAGGQHHAMRTMASGFCVYNDCAAALSVALNAGRRVAYVDFDAHHGDGVQAAFYDEPRALTISIHESGEYLFPGTGGVEESGLGEGRGACLNIPLPPMSGDDAILLAFDRIVAPAVRAYAPDILLTQMGADTHHADPLTHLTATLALFPQLAARLHDLVHETCAGKWLITGGGGYDPFDVTPRAWTAFIGTVLGHVNDDLPLPETWVQASRAAGGDPPSRLLADPGPGYTPLPGPGFTSTLREIEETALADLVARHAR